MASTNPGEPVRSAQKIVDVLSAQGVEHIFGIPGAKIDAVYDALVDGGPQLVVCQRTACLDSERGYGAIGSGVHEGTEANRTDAKNSQLTGRHCLKYRP